MAGSAPCKTPPALLHTDSTSQHTCSQLCVLVLNSAGCNASCATAIPPSTCQKYGGFCTSQSSSCTFTERGEDAGCSLGGGFNGYCTLNDPGLPNYCQGGRIAAHAAADLRCVSLLLSFLLILFLESLPVTIIVNGRLMLAAAWGQDSTAAVL
jgi:hypothetical protein